METPVKKTALPMMGGILAIVSGGFKLLGLLSLIIASFFVTASPAPVCGLGEATILLIITMPLAILGTLAIVGGIYALRRKMLGLALAGSIAAFLPWSFLGLASIILIVLSKNEFE
jgi:hypothetical protein